MKKLILTFLLLYPNLSYAQDLLELDPVEVESTSYIQSINKTEETIVQHYVQEHNEIAVKQYSPSDVLVEYHNITLNDSADNKVELSHYPKFLLRNITLSDRVSFGPSYELQNQEINGTILSNISLSTLNEFELFTQFKSPYIEGFFFGNTSPGDFEFVNSKEELQTRENNKQQRLGFSVYSTQLVGTTIIQPFFYYSQFTRGVGGLSEFPRSYKDAEEVGNLVLINNSTSTLLGVSELETSISYRYQTYSYSNPHSKFPRDAQIETDDHSLDISSSYKYSVSFFVVGGKAEYKYNQYKDNSRNQFILNPLLSFEYTSFLINLQAPQIILDTVYPQYSLSFSYSLQNLLIQLSTNRTVRLPTFNELYFRNEFVHGDKNLSPQVDYKTSLLLRYRFPIATLSLETSYSYLQDLIRFTQDTPYLFVAHNIPQVQVVTVTPSLQIDYSIFTLHTNYSYSYSKVDGLYKLPLLSEHEFYLSTGIQSEDYKALLIYSYSSPKYLHFTNTTESISDSNLSIKLSYKYAFVEALMEFNNILNSRRETSIQFPLPRFNASFSLKILL